MGQQEQVLVVERKAVEEGQMFQGFTPDVERYLDKIFAAGVPRFMPRPQVEADPSFKQLIPYVIMEYDGKYLSYIRGKRAGEKRLMGLRSIGIGGHINPADDLPLFYEDFYQTYRNAVEREVQEEVTVRSGYTEKIVGLINDDSNEVGRVHLGIVHCWTLDSPQVDKSEQMITQMNFMSPDELAAVRDSMETWSQLCLDNLSKIDQ